MVQLTLFTPAPPVYIPGGHRSVWADLGSYILGDTEWPADIPRACIASSSSPATLVASESPTSNAGPSSSGGTRTDSHTTCLPMPTPTRAATSDAAYIAAKHRDEVNAWSRSHRPRGDE